MRDLLTRVAVLQADDRMVASRFNLGIDPSWLPLEPDLERACNAP